jgi:uncharacterized metal-binding protein YceD (DUF177 family)
MSSKTGDGDRTLSKGSSKGASKGSWRAFVPVIQIPDSGLHRDIEADQPTRAALADIAGLRDIAWVRASFDLTPKSGGRVHLSGRVQARVGQTCVVTLEPLENEIDEEIDLIFAPADQIPELAEPADSDDAFEMAEPPEPIENGVIDLGRLATDVLYLAIDPYPRKQGAVFEQQAASVDPDDNPFAALKALRPGPDAGEGASPRKPKDP